MKKNSRILAVAGLAGAAAMALSGLSAGHADAGKLPGSFKHKDLGDGNSVTIRLYDESATISRAVTNIPTSREALVSGKIAVTTSGDIKGATLTAGYLVGCQLNFGASAGAETSDLLASGDVSVTPSGGFTSARARPASTRSSAPRSTATKSTASASPTGAAVSPTARSVSASTAAPDTPPLARWSRFRSRPTPSRATSPPTASRSASADPSTALGNRLDCARESTRTRSGTATRGVRA